MAQDCGTADKVNADDVEVHHKRDGCPICGSTRRHFHTQQAWRDAVEEAGRSLMREIRKGWGA